MVPNLHVYTCSTGHDRTSCFWLPETSEGAAASPRDVPVRKGYKAVNKCFHVRPAHQPIKRRC